MVCYLRSPAKPSCRTVVAGRAADGVQAIAHRTLQPAAVQAVVALGVTDHRLDGLPAFKPAPLQRGQRLVLAPVDDLHARVPGLAADWSFTPVVGLTDALDLG